ncbi:TPA: hypothetical protein ACXLHF_003980 [Klebsiella pneumoniae]
MKCHRPKWYSPKWSLPEMGNEMPLSEMERNDPPPAEMDGSARTDRPARLLACFRTAVPCVVKELFWFVLFVVHIAKT